jgi:hypothetical protein
MKASLMVSNNTSLGVWLLTSALTAFNPKSVNVDNEKKCIKPFARLWVNSWLLQLGHIEKHGLSFELLR